MRVRSSIVFAAAVFAAGFATDAFAQEKAEAEQERARAEEDFLRHSVDELRKFAPVAGEEQELSDADPSCSRDRRGRRDRQRKRGNGGSGDQSQCQTWEGRDHQHGFFRGP